MTGAEALALFVQNAPAFAATMSAIAAIMSVIAAFLSTRYARRLLRHQEKVLDHNKQIDSAESFRFVVGLMETVRNDRNALRDFVKRRAGSGTKMSEAEKGAADRVCRQHDILGLFDRHGLLDRRIVNEFYGGSLIELYENILRERASELGRGPGHFWELHQLYDRVKKDRAATLRVTGKSTWLAKNAQETSLVESG